MYTSRAHLPMIPLVLMAGFLGAGKTRFLSEIIPALGQRGLRSRVILNDFQNANIDAARLGQLDALVTPLNGECVCCGSLRELLQTLYDIPAESGSVMLIEANGATETDELLGHLSTDGRLKHFTLPLQLTVVDAARWQKRWWHNALERAQVATATHVYLNWTERLGAPRQALVGKQLGEVNARAARVTPESFADVLADTLRAPGASADAGIRREDAALPRTSVAPHRHPFASLVLALPESVDRSAFLRFVQTLPEAVVRAKGLVRFRDTPGAMFVWHRVPGRQTVRLDRSWPHDDANPTALFIGVAMPIADLQGAVDALG
ncbi:GTP-binding protein [Gemmatimonas sp.]|uniref:CobW family GTP-binding protein n=1 Tax=Gemmatimonas sp. TaxID=1962908 RepID=UPI00333EF130